MEINGTNMIIAQAASSLALAGNGDTAGLSKGKLLSIAEQANTGGSQSTDTAATKVYAVLIDSNYIKEQIHSLMFDFPPFFPAGSPQRLDLIKGIKGVQDEIKKSPLPAEVKAKLTDQELTESSTDKEITTALKGIKQYTEQHTASPAPAPKKDDSQSVKIVSINI
jgi:hypothetical protein